MQMLPSRCIAHPGRGWPEVALSNITAYSNQIRYAATEHALSY